MITKDAKKEKTKTSKQTLTTGEIKKLCMKGLGLNTMYTLNDDFIKNKETFSQLWNQKQNRTHCSLKQAGLWFMLRTAGAQILQPLRLGQSISRLDDFHSGLILIGWLQNIFPEAIERG